MGGGGREGAHKARSRRSINWHILCCSFATLRLFVNSNAIFIKHTCDATPTLAAVYTYPSDTFCCNTRSDCRHSQLLTLRHRLSPLAPVEHLAVAAVARLPNSNDRQINFQENIYRKIDLTCHASMLEEQPGEAARRSIQAKQPVPICDFGQRCGHR